MDSIWTSSCLRYLFSRFILACALALACIIITDIVPVNGKGFFCGDASIAFAYQEPTYSSRFLHVVSIGLPLAVIFVVESLRSLFCTPLQSPSDGDKNGHEHDSDLHELKGAKAQVGLVLVRMLALSVDYLASLAFGTLLPALARSFVYRPRPHFMDVCRPVAAANPGLMLCEDKMAAEDNRTGSNSLYMTDFTCSGLPGLEPGVIQDSHRSFFSGHACLFSQMTVFVSLYLQHRRHDWPWLIRDMLWPIVQVSMVVLAFAVGASQYAEHFHHAVDLFVGAWLGAVVEILLVRNLFASLDLFLTSGEGRVQ